MLGILLYQRVYGDLSLIPSLSTDQILTIPFHSAKRNRSTEPLILTSPKYIFKRGNGDQISEDIRNRGTMRLELTRRPCTKSEFVQNNQDLLSPTQQAKIVDEIDWGTSTKPQQIQLRDRLQDHPFFNALLGRHLSRTQTQRLNQNPVLKDRVKGSHLAVMVRVSKGVQERIRRGAQVHQVLVLPSKGPAKNAQVVVQIQGVEEQINLAPRFAIEPPKLLTQRPAVISEDANQLGNFTLEFAAIDNPPNLGNPHEIPIEWGPAFLNDLARFNQWNAKLKGLDAENAHLQAKLARGNITSPLRIKEQIRLKHNRRAGIKQEVDHWAARMGYSAVVSTQAPILAMEDLASLGTRGKRGALAKIVNYMVKRQTPIVAKIQAWARAAQYPLEIKLVDPKNSSKNHFVSDGICSGKITRNGDVGTCSVCQQTAMAHHNAACNIAVRAIR